MKINVKEVLIIVYGQVQFHSEIVAPLPLKEKCHHSVLIGLNPYFMSVACNIFLFLEATTDSPW
jgi:hypothetical protein